MAEIKKALVISLESGLPICCYSTDKNKNAGQLTDEELRLSSLLFTSHQIQMALAPFEFQRPLRPPHSNSECMQQGDQSLFTSVGQNLMVAVVGMHLPQGPGLSLVARLSDAVHQAVSASKNLGWRMLKQLLLDSILAVLDELCLQNDLGVPLFAVQRPWSPFPRYSTQHSSDVADSPIVSSPPSPMRTDAARSPSPSKATQSGLRRYQEEGEESGETLCCWWKNSSVSPAPPPPPPSLPTTSSPATSSAPLLPTTSSKPLVLLGKDVPVASALDIYASLLADAAAAADASLLVSPSFRVYALDAQERLGLPLLQVPSTTAAAGAAIGSVEEYNLPQNEGRGKTSEETGPHKWPLAQPPPPLPSTPTDGTPVGSPVAWQTTRDGAESTTERGSFIVLVQDSQLTVAVRVMRPLDSLDDAVHWQWLCDVLHWSQACLHSQAFPPQCWVTAG